MNRIARTLLTLSLLFMPGIAMAGPATTGDAISNFDSDIFTNVPMVLADFFFLCGVILVCAGLYHLASGHNQGSQTKKSHGGWMLLCGILMASLPLVLGVDVGTLLGVGAFTGGDSASVGSTTSCLSGTSNSAMECVLRNISVNVVPIAIHTAFLGCYLVAAIIACSIILQLASSRRNNVDEPRHWKIKLAVAGILLNVPMFLSDLGSSFGYGQLINGDGYQGLDGDSPSSLLTYVPPGGASDALQQYAGTIQWAFVILSMFGIFYAIYGIALLMKFEEGHHTKASAWVHIVAGILLANIGETVQFIWPTFFGGSA